MRINKQLFERIVQYLQSFDGGIEYLESLKEYKTWELRLKNDFNENNQIFFNFSKEKIEETETPIDVKTTTLKDITVSEKLFIPIKTNTPIDEVISLKGGIMPATNILIYGDAGLGKTTIWLDILCKINKENPDRKVLYISSEMDEFDMFEYKERIEGLENIELFFLNDYIENSPTNNLNALLDKGYDFVLIDSLAETINIINDDLKSSIRKIESYIVDIFRKHNKGMNERNVHTSFGLIQQVTKGGNFVGSNKLKHNTTATMELRLDKEGQYLFFSKNRRGKCYDKLYYSFGKTGIHYDFDKYKETLRIKELKTKNQESLFKELEEFEESLMAVL